MRARKLAQFIFSCHRTISQYYKGVRCFSPTLVRQSNDRDFLYGGVAQQNSLNFDRRNILTAADDHILQAIANILLAGL